LLIGILRLREIPMLYHKSAIDSNVKVLIPLAGAKSYTVTLVVDP